MRLSKTVLPPVRIYHVRNVLKVLFVRVAYVLDFHRRMAKLLESIGLYLKVAGVAFAVNGAREPLSNERIVVI